MAKATNEPTQTMSVNQNNTVNKAVRFSARDQILEIPDIDSYSEQEIDCLWFSQSKLDKIKRQTRAIFPKWIVGSRREKILHVRAGDQARVWGKANKDSRGTTGCFHGAATEVG